jgi:dihydroxyacetone kinase-like protein
VKNQLTSQEFIEILDKMATDLPEQSERLRELDAAIGDGDLGITITIGFEAVRDTLPTVEDQDIGSILMKTGMAFNRKAASTFGALYATMMMRAARVARGEEAVDREQFVEMARAAVEGVKERGKADVGDKTMLDAMVPAVDALEEAVADGEDIVGAVDRAAAAAQEGMEATVDLKSKTGRASWFSDRTAGIQDPGATAVYMMIASLQEYLHDQ